MVNKKRKKNKSIKSKKNRWKMKPKLLKQERIDEC